LLYSPGIFPEQPKIPENDRGPKNRFIRTQTSTTCMDKKIIFTLLCILIFPATFLVLSGDFLCPEGWFFVSLVYSSVLFDNPVPEPERSGITGGTVQAARHR
jgi:hypothetical protein